MNFKNLMRESVNVSTSKITNYNWSKVDFSTPFVDNMIEDIANSKNVPKSQIVNEVKTQLKEQMDEMKDKPDSFYKVQRMNAIESVLFGMLDAKDEEFDQKKFYYMFDAILAKNKAFLKIKDPITGKRLKLNIMLTPAPPFIKQPDWVKSVKTAAASPEGDLIFYIPFCKELIKYARLKGIKAKGGMYQSNGGDVPDSYAYIEFLILHEIYHIVHADHFFQTQKEGMTPTLQNYLGDFITNSTLVANGYPQLPIGLFSDYFTYNNFHSMDALQNAIIEESKKLSDNDHKDLQQKMDDHMDQDHNQTNKQDGQQDGQSQDGQQDGQSQDGQQDGQSQEQDGQSQDGQQDGQSQDGQQDGQSQEQDGQSQEQDGQSQEQDGQSQEQDGQSQDGQQNKTDDITKKMDKAFKETDKNFQKADDGLSKEEIDKKIKENQEEIEKEQEKERQKAKDALEQQKQNSELKKKEALDSISKFIPINWKMLIKKMIPKAKEKSEESYSRMSRKTRAQIVLGNEKIAVKPGERKEDDESQSLLFILDSSGSMADKIDSISLDLLKLIQKNASLGIKSMWFIRFDSNYRVYKANLDPSGKATTYQELINPKDLLTAKDLDKIKLKDQEKPIRQLFELSWGGGTDFPRDIFLIIKKFLKEDFNQVLFTDSDITWGENIKNLKKACMLGKKKKFSFNVILDSKSTFDQISDKLGGTYKYMSYLDSK